MEPRGRNVPAVELQQNTHLGGRDSGCAPTAGCSPLKIEIQLEGVNCKPTYFFSVVQL